MAYGCYRFPCRVQTSGTLLLQEVLDDRYIEGTGVLFQYPLFAGAEGRADAVLGPAPLGAAFGTLGQVVGHFCSSRSGHIGLLGTPTDGGSGGGACSSRRASIRCAATLRAAVISQRSPFSGQHFSIPTCWWVSSA